MTEAPAPAAPAKKSLRSLWYDTMQFTGMAAFTLGFSFRYEGTRHVPKTGPALIIANHQSYVDPWIIGLAVRRHLTYLARKTLFKNRIFASILHSLNAIPIDQEGVSTEGLKALVDKVRQGHAVVIFPEGSRTPDGVIHPLRPGIQLLIKRTGAPIIPVGIAGAYEAWPIWRNYPVLAPLFLPAAPGAIAVCIGAPIPSSKYGAMPRAQAMAELGEELQKIQLRAENLRRC